MGFSVGQSPLAAQRWGRNTCEAGAVAPAGLPGVLIERQESLSCTGWADADTNHT